VLVNTLILLAVQGGILLGVYLPAVDGKMINQFPHAAYITAHGFIALPIAIVGTLIQFWLASSIGRPIVSFLVTALVFVMAYVVGIFMLFPGVTNVIIPD
jgi:hypothetical protein